MLRLKREKMHRARPRSRVEVGYPRSAVGFHADCKNPTDCAIKSIKIRGSRHNLILSKYVSNEDDPNYGKHKTELSLTGVQCVRQSGDTVIEVADGSPSNLGYTAFDEWRRICYNRYYHIAFDYEIEPYADGSIPRAFMSFAFGKADNPRARVTQYNGTATAINPNGEANGSFSVILIRTSYSYALSGAPLLDIYFNSSTASTMVGNGKITIKNLDWSEAQGWTPPPYDSSFLPERIIGSVYTDQPIGSCAEASDEVEISSAMGEIRIIKRTELVDGELQAIDTPYEISVPAIEPIMLTSGQTNRVQTVSFAPPLEMKVEYFSSVR